MQRVAILGATGSIGASALDVIARHPDRMRASLLAAGTRVDELLALCRVHRPEHAVIADAGAYAALREGLRDAGLDTQAHAGAGALDALVAGDACDSVVAAIVGAAGLPSTLAAARAGKRLLLANKESLVLAGELLMQAASANGAVIVPIDSEHNAIFQCLAGNPGEMPARITLTASGGPFRGWTREALATVTPAQAVAHPKWSMGPKISVDSASLMNKGLEVIEARWLFDMDLERIEVMLHPESIVHSMVELTDGSLLAQLSVSDMRFAIQYALTWPQRLDGQLPPLDLARLGALHFSLPDMQRFPCLALARAAARAGGTMPAVLNAANEVAVEEFLADRLSFAGIWRVVEQTMATHHMQNNPDLAAIMHADNWARRAAREKAAG